MASELGQLVGAELAKLRATAADLSTPLQAAPYDGPEPSATGSFAERMANVVRSVNLQDHDAGQLMSAVDSGQSDDLVGAMLASQQAGLSFSMLMQVRNKVMSAVEDLVKLPI